MAESEGTFWADQVADKLAKSGRKPVVSTGITPSGEIHIGHLREMVTADVVYRAYSERHGQAEFHYFADTLDPLRRVYEFLDPNVYNQHVGKPIGRIPCPCGKHESYADHFVQPFFDSLERLGMQPKVIWADDMYKRDEFTDVVIRALKNRDAIAAILSEATGKVIDEQWSPFNPICAACQRIQSAVVVGFSAEARTFDYSCKCGEQGELPIVGNGKLTWRVDWPARWSVLGVTMEPFGKDHGTDGGSYDTGVRIAREIFDYEAPLPVMYEWIGLRGAGDMSSSKGNLVSIDAMLEVAPGDVLRYFVLRSKPNKRLTFDPVLPLVSLIDEFDGGLGSSSERARQLAQIGDHRPLGVPFKHLITLVQICGEDVELLIKRLALTGFEVEDRSLLEERITFARNWLTTFAPDSMRFELQLEMPESASMLSEPQRAALHRLADKLSVGMNGDEIHKAIYDVKESLGVEPKEIFEAAYTVLLDRRRGPRLGMFLAALDLNWVIDRLRAV